MDKNYFKEVFIGLVLFAIIFAVAAWIGSWNDYEPRPYPDNELPSDYHSIF